METKNNYSEVIENFKNELREGLSTNQDIVLPEIEEGYEGVCALVDGIGYFFEFEYSGDNVRNLDDESVQPIIQIQVSTFATFPKLTANQRIALMERLGDCLGITMKKMKGDDYCLKTSGLFFDSRQMYAVAVSSLSYMHESRGLIHDFLKTALKIKK